MMEPIELRNTYLVHAIQCKHRCAWLLEAPRSKRTLINFISQHWIFHGEKKQFEETQGNLRVNPCWVISKIPLQRFLERKINRSIFLGQPSKHFGGWKNKIMKMSKASVTKKAIFFIGAWVELLISNRCGWGDFLRDSGTCYRRLTFFMPKSINFSQNCVGTAGSIRSTSWGRCSLGSLLSRFPIEDSIFL